MILKLPRRHHYLSNRLKLYQQIPSHTTVVTTRLQTPELIYQRFEVSENSNQSISYTSSDLPFPSLQIPYYTSTYKPPSRSTKGRSSPKTTTHQYRILLPITPFPFPSLPYYALRYLALHCRTVIVYIKPTIPTTSSYLFLNFNSHISQPTYDIHSRNQARSILTIRYEHINITHATTNTTALTTTLAAADSTRFATTSPLNFSPPTPPPDSVCWMMMMVMMSVGDIGGLD